MSKTGIRTERQGEKPVQILCVGFGGQEGSLAGAVDEERDRFAVTTVESAQAGLDSLEAEPFDCVVSSYRLPESDGLELFEAVRGREITIPFVLHDYGETVPAEGFAAGVSGYVHGDQPAVLADRIETEVDSYRDRQRARKTKDALEEIRDGIAVFDDDGQFQYVNEVYASFYGYRPEELVGGGWEQLYPPTEVERYRNSIQPLLENQGSWVGECECLHRDGFRFRSTHSISQLDDGGHVCVIHNGSVAASER